MVAQKGKGIAFDRVGFRKDSGHRIRLLRKRAGLTQKQTAEQVGISRATFANIESGRQSIVLDCAWKLAIVLGVRLHHLTPETITRWRAWRTTQKEERAFKSP